MDTSQSLASRGRVTHFHLVSLRSISSQEHVGAFSHAIQFIFFSCVSFIFSVSAYCQTLTESAQPIVKVVAVSGDVEVDDLLEVTIIGLNQWAKTQGHAPWRLVPYLNGRALVGVYPVAVNVRTGTLQFHLRMTPENRASWNNVLSPPTLTKKIRFSVGLELQDPFETELTLEGKPANLIVMEIEWAIAALAMACVLTASFFWLASNSPILMERVTYLGGEVVLRFSLAKVQLAIWFFVIFGAFIIIWLSTGNYDTINSSIVAVLGISAGTALGDSYIKSRLESRHRTPIKDGQPERKELSESTPSLAVHDADARPLPKHFFRDLVSDSDGYSIYRFQIIAWTVVLITIFVSNVYYSLTMPEFRPDLLYLLGLSSGTYIAHRVPETRREVRTNPEFERASDRTLMHEKALAERALAANSGEAV